mmetsp:Transcript_18737/g.45240  ORF Transcript_18737/g.45240 Transcript_18737/m.45240 type:complete len:601 (+) Transcript_18737:310-2112(+)
MATTTPKRRGRSIIDHLAGPVETTATTVTATTATAKMTKYLVNLVVIGGLLLLLCSSSIGGGRGYHDDDYDDDKVNGIDGRHDNNISFFSIVVIAATAFTTTTTTTTSKRFLHSPNNNNRNQQKISHHWLDLIEKRRTPTRTVTRTSPSSLSSSSSSSSESRRRNLTANSGDRMSPTTTKGVDMVAIRANNNNGDRRDIDDDDCLVEERPTKHVARERQPPFPSSAYSDVQEEEEGLTYNYISFIDQSILKTYSQQTRLIEPRRYALPEQFETKNANVEPTIDDVAMPQTNYGPVARLFAWNGLPARTVVGSASYLVFPYIIELLDTSTELSKLVDSFLPGISIVLGTYFSLTISILYDRQTRLTEAVNLECSQLALTLINLLHLFENTDEDAAVEGAQCVADQVRVLVHDNRGRETMGVVYSDPYARLLRLLKDYSNTDICTSLVNDAYLLADLHGNVGRLFQLRTDRLTVESLALAPTHFDVMTFLCGLLLAGFALGTVATATQDGVPSETAQVLFAGLVVCYTIFYEMAFDLNRPFDGIYQIRRSGAAMHLLQIKQIVTTHPVLKDRVDFEAIGEDDGEAGECDGDCQRRKARIWYN